jgi:hypothetical protein
VATFHKVKRMVELIRKHAPAERMRSFCRSAIAGLFPALFFGPSKEARRRARELLRDIERETGAMTLGERLKGAGAVLLSGWTWFTMRMNLFQQPKLLRLEYHPEKSGAGVVADRAANSLPISQPVSVLNEE